MSLRAPYGLVVRYAVKANPHPEIIRIFDALGLHFDASSSYEAAHLLSLGIKGEKISLSSQQSPHNLEELLALGVRFVATSKRQLELFLKAEHHPQTVGLRVNPPTGHGHNNRTTTGGVNASFGLWHEYLEEALFEAKDAGVAVDRLHIHIGSGARPEVWGSVMDEALTIVARMPEVQTLDIGGGYKVSRGPGEEEASMSDIMSVFSERLSAFMEKTGRKIALEIEPGTYAVAHAGVLVASVDDIVDTGPTGHTFLRLNTGMNDFLRTALYGAYHRIEVCSDAQSEKEYVVVGHNCESGDLFSSAPGNPEEILPRQLKEASIGDEVRIYDMGAYCASMRAKGYNSFPDAGEVLV